MKLTLQNDITSPQELKAIILEVHRYAKWFAQTSVKARVSGSQAVEPINVSEAAGVLITGAAAEGVHTSKSLDALIAALETLEKESERITITLAGTASGSLKKQLVAWCRQNIDTNILVDFRFDSTLLGGMIVRYGSHVYDWSFKRKILVALPKFPEILRNV